MVELSKELLISAYAQGIRTTADAIARPTFVTDLDFTQPGGGLGGNNPDPDPEPDPDPVDPNDEDAAGTIKLSTTNSNFAPNTEFSVDITLHSDGAKVNSYSVKVEYDPTLLAISDGNPTLTGLQIETTNPDFTVVENTVNNTNGTMILKAETSVAAALSNKVVGKIKFKVLNNGSAEIKVSRIESSIVDQSSQNILEAITGLNIKTGSNIGTADEIIDTPLIPTGVDPNISDLPKSDLPFSGLIYVMLGLGLVYAGLVGKRLSKKKVR